MSDQAGNDVAKMAEALQAFEDLRASSVALHGQLVQMTERLRQLRSAVAAHIQTAKASIAAPEELR